jgi:hypothetical protein
MWRISADILLFVSIFLLPWWFTTILLFVWIIAFRMYWEGFLAGLLVDLLYAPASSLSLVSYRFAFGSLALLLLTQLVARRFVRGYEN